METCGPSITPTPLHTIISMKLMNNLFISLSMDAALILKHAMETCGPGITPTHLHTIISMTLMNDLFIGLSMNAGLILEACNENLWSQYNTS